MSSFFDVRRLYVDVNAATLRWMLDRPALHGVFLNTKVNSLTLADYTDADGWRGPSFLYGWIQGRGLESLVTHAAFFAHEDRDLSGRLDEAGRRLYPRLAELFERHDEHGYFCYDAELKPVIPDANDRPTPQAGAGDAFTYSDIFFIKGLIAASARYDEKALDRYVARLRDVIRAIETDRFVIDERRSLNHGKSAADSEDFGPWMIALGAAGLMRRLGLDQEASFSHRFIERVLSTCWDGRSANPTDLIRDSPDVEQANPGHAIEFVGFAHDALPANADPALLKELQRILVASFAAGFRGPGVALSVTPRDHRLLSPHYPWWSLPETIRAAVLTYERTRRDDFLDIWRRTEHAFFANYWRGTPPIAYQTRSEDGPVDFVPATPDLDPGYHTGLSLLGAIEAIDRMGKA